jgi:hypothetical protein
MISLRRPFWREFGASLAGLALCVQLLLASAGLLVYPPATGGPADIFGEHALCLASTGAPAQAPAPAGDQSPDGTTHLHVGFCCLWHLVPAIQPTAPPALQPVVYARIVRAGRSDELAVANRWQSPHNARAPPLIV